MLTYKSQALERADKAQLETMRKALNAAETTLRLDECGLWIIQGAHGYISTWGDGVSFMLMVSTGGSKRQWTFDKAKLAFCEVTQNGDDEGVFRLRRLPATGVQADEPEIIRAVLRIRKSPNTSDVFREESRTRMKALRAAQLGRPM